MPINLSTEGPEMVGKEEMRKQMRKADEDGEDADRG
jgi:hypothetical protein